MTRIDDEYKQGANLLKRKNIEKGEKDEKLVWVNR